MCTCTCAYPNESKQALTISGVFIHIYPCSYSVLVTTRSDSNALHTHFLAWAIAASPNDVHRLTCMHHAATDKWKHSFSLALHLPPHTWVPPITTSLPFINKMSENNNRMKRTKLKGQTWKTSQKRPELNI